jgi:hypothetical protein
MPETARGHADEWAPRFARSGLRCTCRGQDRFVADPSLAAFLAAMMLFAAALGAHIGIARARAPLTRQNRNQPLRGDNGSELNTSARRAWRC